MIRAQQLLRPPGGIQRRHTGLPPTRLIAVDVDGTLHAGGQLNDALVAWCRQRKAEGFGLMLWSARGEAHALHAVETFGLHGLFDHVLGKPGYLVDDKGWAWIADTVVVPLAEARISASPSRQIERVLPGGAESQVVVRCDAAPAAGSETR